MPTTWVGLATLYYLVKRHYMLFGELRGRKKLQKLVFLVEHLDPRTGRLVRSTNTTGYKFIIWFFGPFCKEVYDDMEELVNRNLVVEEVVSAEHEPRFDGINMLMYEDDGSPKTMYIYKPSEQKPWLPLPLFSSRKHTFLEPPGNVKRRVDLVLEKYGKLSATELEHVVLDMLRLTPEKKLRYMGRLVDEYLAEEGLA